MQQKTEQDKAAIKLALDNLFKYHAPRPDQLPRYEAIRAAAKEYASVVLFNTEKGADQSAALRLIRESCFTANAAVALEPEAKPEPITAPGV